MVAAAVIRKKNREFFLELPCKWINHPEYMQMKLSDSLEDYLEAVLLVEKKDGVIRPKAIMEHLDVSAPSVTEALHQLAQKKLVNYIPYGEITLTAKGRKGAEDVFYRHETLKKFFVQVLGIDPEIADEGACKMEHAASKTIIERMVLYTRYLETQDRESATLEKRTGCFKEYLTAKGERQGG